MLFKWFSDNQIKGKYEPMSSLILNKKDEIKMERKIFQYLMSFTLYLIRIMSITQGDQQSFKSVPAMSSMMRLSNQFIKKEPGFLPI